MSPKKFSTCEGSIRNQASLSLKGALNSDHGGYNWCTKPTNLSSDKSSNNDDILLSSQNRNACVSISVGMDA